MSNSTSEDDDNDVDSLTQDTARDYELHKTSDLPPSLLIVMQKTRTDQRLDTQQLDKLEYPIV